MIAELFLICALAPQPVPAVVNFKGWEPMTAQRFVQDYKAIKTFLNRCAPGGEFYVMPKRLHAVPQGYELLPIEWRGHRIYQRRPYAGGVRDRTSG